MSRLNNIHGTAIVLGKHGVLITGASGAGKTTLALALLEKARSLGCFAALVADDQLFASARWGRLIVAAPETIAGLVEVHGLGPKPIATVKSAVIDLACELVAPELTPRYLEPEPRDVAGVPIPALVLPARNVVQSTAAVFARLGFHPFAGMRQNS